MTVPRTWRNPEKISHCRPRPVTDAPAQIPDSKVGQLDFLLHRSGALDLIEGELAGRPGPDGLPVRTVLVGLLLSLHYNQSASLADACRILLDQLQPLARSWLAIPDIDQDDQWARHAFSRRVYRSFDRLTTALDPARIDRRRRLPLAEAAAHAAAWEDNDAERLRRRALLQEISDRLVLVTVRLAQRRGLFKGWRGDIGADTTAVPAWHHEPSDLRDLASVEVTAGWHFSGGSDEGVFGHSATLLVAASRRHTAGHPSAGKRVSKHPQLALGAVLDTPGKRIGPNAVHSLTTLLPLGLPIGLLAADRAYTDQTTEHFQLHARRMGYQLTLDYKQNQRGVQGSHLGAALIDGTLACPAMPDVLANATTGLDDKAVRDLDEVLEQRLAKREPYFLKLKQGPAPDGTLRLQCPAAGPSPSVTCPRFNRVHRPTAAVPAVVDLTNTRSTTAHPSAKPAVQITPAERLRPPPSKELPRICRKPTITVHPGDLGMIDKFRQDRPYLSPTWHDAYKPIRAHNEGLNGRAKGHQIDISDPRKRLAHGRVAQTVLLALMILMINLQILHDWTRTSSPAPIQADDGQSYDGLTPMPLTTNGLPPPPG
ncbi:hypothetical protein ACIRPK_26595 [Kitasatospora sp. NPDC101801]|uniref:hypothetical protein n=1 Tax=Kitasatospora sp. NPDC101801 TaxID=3364103 RepID=UPI0037F41B36